MRKNNIFFVLLFLALSKCELFVFRNGTEILQTQAPYLSSRGYPVGIPESIFGQLYYYQNFNQINNTEVKGKIVLSDWHGPADRNIIELQELGAIGVIYETTKKIGGFRISQFDNLASFKIVAVDIHTDDFVHLIDLLNNGEVLCATLNPDTNIWKGTFNSASFISFKVFWSLFHTVAIVCCAYTLVLIKREIIRVQSITVTHNLILMIITNTIYLLSLIDQQGQDQLLPHQLAISLRSLGNIFMLADILLYIIIMYTIVSSKKTLEVSIFVKNIKFYYIISAVFIGIAVVCQLIVLIGDQTKNFISLMVVVIFCFDFCFMVGCGIFYVIGASMLTKKVSNSQSSKIQMKKNIIYIWITGIAILCRGVWQITVLFFLNDPTTYTMYFWIDNFLYAGVICGLSLQWIVNHKLNVSSKSSKSSNKTSTVIKNAVSSEITPRSKVKSEVVLDASTPENDLSSTKNSLTENTPRLESNVEIL